MKLFTVLLAAALGAGCIVDDSEDLGELESELDVSGWSDDARIDGQNSARQVGLAWFNQQVYMVHNGDASPSELWWSRRNETSGAWRTNVKIDGQRAEGGPALVVLDDTLRMIYRTVGDNRLVMSTFSGSAWQAPVNVGSQPNAQSPPSAVVHGGRLYLAYCKSVGGGNYRIEVDLLEGTRWTPIGRTTTGNMECRHVAIGASTENGETVLHLAWTNYADDPLTTSLWSFHTSDGVMRSGRWLWTDHGHLGRKNKKPISIVSCGGQTHLTHGGHSTPNDIWWSHRSGGRWATERRVPGQASNAGAAMVCAGDSVLMVHGGDTDNRLWYSTYR